MPPTSCTSRVYWARTRSLSHRLFYCSLTLLLFLYLYWRTSLILC